MKVRKRDVCGKYNINKNNIYKRDKGFIDFDI